MQTLKYTIIKSKAQYRKYCKTLEALLEKPGSKAVQEEVELLTLLIEKWDAAHNSFAAVDPIRLLASLMEEHNLKPKDLVALLGMSKGYVSEILHYKKALSKEVVRKLSDHFKIAQEAFNRPYKLVATTNARIKKNPVAHTKKKLAAA